MRLRTKLTALIALASVVPTGAAMLLGRELVRSSFQREFDLLLGNARAEVDKRYKDLQLDVAAAVRRLANPDDHFTGAILIDLARGGLEDETFRRLAATTSRVMKERGLDVLSVTHRQGQVVASGHFPGSVGDTDAGLSKRTAREAHVMNVRVMARGKPATRLAVVVRRVARSTMGSQVTVVGGRTLGPDFVRRLSPGTEVLIRDARGRRVVGPADWSRQSTYPHQVIPLPGPGGKTAATVTVAVPDKRKRRALSLINLTAGALVGCGLLLALVLGVFAARRISRPLSELSEGAEAVAQGDLERQLPVRSRDEIGELVRSFNRMTADLKESKEKLVAAERVAAWREIARRIAHEIKNPLFPIQTSIETLRKVRAKKLPDFEEIFDESTTTILEEVERLKNIATEFSQFARMPKPKLEPCDLAEVVRSVATLYGAEGDVTIESSLPEDLPRVMGDREQLVQVFSNLVKNAKEALAGVEAPRVQVRTEAGEGTVAVSVEDNGPGFTEEVQAKIFTPYFTTKGASGGSGLGLAIVHRIVMDHEGRIEARNLGDAQTGAVFTVELPIA